MAADGRIWIDSRINTKEFERDLKTLQGKIKSAGNTLKNTGQTLTKNVSLPIAGLGAAAISAANEIDAAYKAIQVGTGATGKDLEALKENFDNVFTEVPQSADEVAGALAGLNTMTGATGSTLEGLTKSVLDASRMLGEDGVANAEAFGRSLEQWNVPAEQGVAMMDKLFKATQDYGIGLGELNSQLTTYGPVLQNAGFEMNEAADLFGRLSKNGIQVSRVMPGLNKAFRDWAKEGKNSRDELGKVIEEIQNAESETEALAIATETFGAEGAQRMTTAIRNGVFSLEDLGAALEDSQGLVNQTGEETLTLGERFSMMKNEVMAALEPLGEILMDIAEQWMPILIEKIQQLSEWWNNLSPQTQNIIVLLGGLAVALGPVIAIFGMFIGAVSNLLPLVSMLIKFLGLLINPWALIGVAVVALVVLIVKNWDKIKAATEKVWNAIVEFFKRTWDWIKNTASNIFNGIKDFFSNIWNGIKNTASRIWNGIKNTLSSIWGGIKNTVSNVFGWVKNFFSNTWDNIMSGARRFKSLFLDIWDGIKAGIRFVVNPIASIMNGLLGGIEKMVNAVARGINSLPSFSIPSWVPVIGGGTFGLPYIPQIYLPRIPSLDVGTDRVLSDGLAMIHAGEAIVPADVAEGGFTGGNGSKKPAIINLIMNSDVIASGMIDDIKRLLDDDVEISAFLGGDR